MTVAILLLACLVLAGAVVALGVALRELRGPGAGAGDVAGSVTGFRDRR